MDNTAFNNFVNDFNDILKLAKEKSSAVQVRGQFAGFAPNLQFITFDALKTEDWPNHIGMNSINICFAIDLSNKKVEVRSYGHVYLSPKDKASDKWKYCAMRGILDIAKEDYGVKNFRKQGYKNKEDLFKKMETYFKAVMDAVTKYTGGYPYKVGIAQPEDENAA